jgi:site-specific DNA recombinase
LAAPPRFLPLGHGKEGHGIMSSHNGKGKLRAVGYCRTSGENQRDNTSIPNQKDEITRYLKASGWSFTRFYVDECKSGAKIAGRDAYQQMMRDAANGLFDIIVVFDMTRFGRDGLNILTSAQTLKGDFGVDVVDCKGGFDTRGSDRVLTNFVHAGMAQQERIRILERTKRGRIRKAREQHSPLGSKRPFGRIWRWHDVKKTSGEWSIDEDKQRMVQECARRYLAGEWLDKLGPEFGTSHGYLHTILTKSCGPIWIQRVRCAELGIDETIETPIPPLLDDKTIEAVKARAQANKTYHRGQLKNPYLLAHFVFCSHCGYSMFGQTNNINGNRHYRHAHSRRDRVCERPKASVNAERLERIIMLYLFDLFGNASKVQRAIQEALPDQNKTRELEERLVRIKAELAELGKKRGRLIDAIAEGTIGKDAVTKKLDELAHREGVLRQEQGSIDATLANIPSAEQVKRTAEEIAGRFHYDTDKQGRTKRRAQKRRDHIVADLANAHFEQMTWQEKRELCAMVFGGKAPSGKRLGVYIEWAGEGARNGQPKEWKFTIQGRLIHEAGTVPSEPTEPPEEFTGGSRQKALLEEVTRSAGR